MMENETISTLKQKLYQLKDDWLYYAVRGDRKKSKNVRELIMDIEEKIEDFEQKRT